MKNRPPRKAQPSPTANSTITTTTGEVREPKPWLLPFRDLPLILRDHGVMEAHIRPRVGRRLPDDSIRSWRCAPAEAWAWPLVEWARTGSSFVAVVLDIDSRDGLERLAAANMSASPHAPTPNFVAYRKVSGHALAAYTLRQPVLRGPHARPKPLAVLARIAEWLRQALGADAGFTGVLVSNPVHADYHTVWLKTRGYSLAELRRYVPRGWRQPRPPRTDIGRNCAIFTSLMRYAGSAHHSDDAVRQHADQLYQQIDIHRPHTYSSAELADTVAWVLRQRARWRIHGWHSEEWIKRQQIRGRRNDSAQQVLKGIRSGEARRRKTQERDARILQALKAQGLRQVARAFGLHHTTVIDIRDRKNQDGSPGGG